MTIKEGFNLLATAPDGVARLRELILTLAVQGKLAPQDSNDEPASVLLKQIAKEKHHSEPVSKGKRKASASRLTIQSEKPPLPRAWEWSSLAEIGVISPRNNADDDLPVSFVQMSSIPTALVSPHCVEERPWSAIKTGFTHFAEGDVGVAKITPCFENGKSTVFRNLTNGIGAGTTELHIVRPLGGILPDYVLIFLKTPEFLLNGENVMTGSAGQKRLPRDYFENTPFPLPPLAEQPRIVAKVHELMRLCDALETNGRLEAEQHARLTTTLFEALAASKSAHALAENWSRVAANFDLVLDRPEAVDALEQTILQLAIRGLLVLQDPTDESANELLHRIQEEKDRLIKRGEIKRDKVLPEIDEGEQSYAVPESWEWARLGTLCSVVTDGEHLTPERTTDKSQVPLVTAKNVRDGFMDYEVTDYVPRPVAEKCWTRCRPRANDLLMVSVGATTGRLSVLQEDREMVLVRSVTLLRPVTAGLDPAYLELHLNSPDSQREIWSSVKQNAQPCLYLSKSVCLTIALPPLAEQRRIVARVNELRGLCANLRACLTDRQACQAHLAEALVTQTATPAPDEGNLLAA